MLTECGLDRCYCVLAELSADNLVIYYFVALFYLVNVHEVQSTLSKFPVESLTKKIVSFTLILNAVLVLSRVICCLEARKFK